MGGGELEKVTEAFETNWIAPLGPHVNGFEKDIQDYNGVSHAVALSSGTSAIHLALLLYGIGESDYVLVQDMTFSATINPIIYQGAIPVFIDSESSSWNMDPEFLKKGIEDCLAGKFGEAKLPKAIMPVHLYGMPANMKAIMEIGEKYDIPVIEDAAESLGSKFNDKFTGSFGDFGIYSFNGNKIITTSGGGALVSENEALIHKARFLATQARDAAPHYQHSEIGYNYRLSNVLAGIGRGQMTVLNDRVSARRANFERYRKYFEAQRERGFNILFQEEAKESYSNRWLSCILINPEQNKGLNREDIRLFLESVNIECRPLWKPMHLQPVFEQYPYVGDGTSEKLFDLGLCMPSGSNLSENDFERIFKALDDCFNNR